MSLAYRLIAISDASRALKGGQSRFPDSADIELNKDNGTWIGRGVGPEDFRIPVSLVQYSTKHCYFRYDDCQSVWSVVDHSTNGTFIKPPMASGWQRLKKGEATELPLGCELRLSAPQKESEPLHYRLESYVPEPVQIESAESKDQAVASAKRARTGAKKGENLTPHKLANEPISQLVELRKNNERLREQLVNERKVNEALTNELSHEKSQKVTLEDEIVTVKQQLSDQVAQYHSLEGSLQESQQRNQELQEHLRSLSEEMRTLQTENGDLVKKRDELQTCVQNLQENLCVTEEELKTLQAQKLEIEGELELEQEARASEKQAVAEFERREAEVRSIAETATATIAELEAKVKGLEGNLQLERSRVEEFKLVEEGAKHWKDTVNSVIGQMAQFMDTMAKRSKSRAELAMKDCEEIDVIRREIRELKDQKDESLLATNEEELVHDDHNDEPEENADMEDTQNQEAAALATINYNSESAPPQILAQILGELNGNSTRGHSDASPGCDQGAPGLGGVGFRETSHENDDEAEAVDALEPYDKVRTSQPDRTMQENNICGSEITSDI